jgi:carbonic anhydrase
MNFNGAPWPPKSPPNNHRKALTMLKRSKLHFVTLVAVSLIGFNLSHASNEVPKEQTRLEKGNARFVSGTPQHPRSDEMRREETVGGQRPFATILTCSDSRLPVERIFDQGIGDLFVIRVAGNVAGVSEIATAEYGVGHLHTPLMVVMGHKGCGAVAAAATGAEVHGALPHLLAHIKPAIESVKQKNSHLEKEEFLAAAVTANVHRTMEELLRTSAPIQELVEKHELILIGAVYDIESGQIEWLGPHPEQSGILAESSKPLPRAHEKKPAAAEKSHGH